MKRLKDWQLKTRKLLNKNTLLLALVTAICLIVLSVGLGWYNNRLVPHTANPSARYLAEPSNPLSFLSNWDGPDYIKLAHTGYQTVVSANFFPLYPLLIHLVNMVIRSPLDSALLISWVCLVGAIYYYIKVLKHIFKIKDNLSTIKGLVFFVLFPASIFLVATYTESLFAFLSLGAIYYAYQKRYLVSGLFMLFGCATHVDGLFVLALVCLILFEEKVKPLQILSTFVIALLGLIGYSIYLGEKFSRPLAFIFSQKDHGWLNHHYTELFQSASFFNVVFVILLIVTIIYWWNRRRSFSYYSILFLLVPIIGNQFGGFNRYMLVAFPLQFMAYDYLKDRHISYSFLLAAMGIAWAFFALQYAGGYIGG